MNYYEELLVRIHQLMDEKDYQQAYQLIEDELSMPYIPGDIEQQLKALMQEVKLNLSDDVTVRYDVENIARYLASDSLDCQYRAVELLHHSNIRQYTNEIQLYLLNDKHDDNVVALIIHELKNQQVDMIFSVRKGQTEIEFNPKEIPSIFEQDIYVDVCDTIIDSLYLSQDASMANMMKEMLHQSIIALYPVTITSKEDIEQLLVQCARQVYTAYQLEDEFDEKRIKKELENVIIV